MAKTTNLLICFIFLLLFNSPVFGQERKIIGISSPNYSLTYEKEFANNKSILLDGSVFYDTNFRGDAGSRFSLTLGTRFYKGNNKTRPYLGLYNKSIIDARFWDASSEFTYTDDLIGAIGYEWQFGDNFRFFIEGGIQAIYFKAYSFNDLMIVSYEKCGFGFNL